PCVTVAPLTASSPISLFGKSSPVSRSTVLYCTLLPLNSGKPLTPFSLGRPTRVEIRSKGSPISVVTPEETTSVCPYPVIISVTPRTSSAFCQTDTGAADAPHHMANKFDKSNSLTLG